MKKGVIYVRVSDSTQVNGTSLDSQERACLEYAARNDIEAVRVFIEKGESATAANRTEFLKALDFCREHKGGICAFIVWKIDRFARNTTDHFAVRAKLTQFGTNLFSVTEPITQDPMGKLTETFLAGYAEFENEVRKQRCTGGMQGRLRMGIWCWSPPIGYVNSKKIKDRRKTMPDIPDEERFYLIQRGIRLYKAGNHTLEALAEETSRWGLRTRTGQPMRKQIWETILKDKFYAGILIDPWTGEEYPGEHRPMITLQEHEEIQRIKKRKSNKATTPRRSCNPDFPLRGFVRCECGQPYTGSWSKGRNKRYAGYHCHNNHCTHYGHVVPKHTLETKFYELLREVSPRPEFLAAFKKAVIDYLRERSATEMQDKKRHRSGRLKLEKQRKELVSMRINREISAAEYKETKESLDRQIASLIASEQVQENVHDMETAVSLVMKFIQNVADEWKAMAAPYKQRLQKVVLTESIKYQKTDGVFGTAILSPIFRLGGTFLADASGLVAEVGQNWNQILNNIMTIYEFARDLAKHLNNNSSSPEHQIP